MGKYHYLPISIVNTISDVSLWVDQTKATGNSRSGIPGNSRESRTPKFPAGIPGNFWNSGGNYGEFMGSLSFFQFLYDYDILVFNLTRCIMCTTRDRLTAFCAKPWMTSLTQLFVFMEFRYTFKYWYRKITEQRQNFANSDRYTNMTLRYNSNRSYNLKKPRFCIHRLKMEDVLRGGSVRGTSVWTGERVCWYNGDRSLPVSLDMWDVWKAVCDMGLGVDFKTLDFK